MLKTIGVRCFPWGFAQLIQRNRIGTLPVHTLDTQWQNFTQRMQHVHHEEALRLIQQRLMESATAAKTNHANVAMGSQRMYVQKGDLRIHDLADECHVSRRQLERKFKTIVGVSPKMLARQIRFEHVRDRLCDTPDSNLSMLAGEYGYADQAHLSRDFKALSGRTLREFVSEIQTVQIDLRFGVAFSCIENANPL